DEFSHLLADDNVLNQYNHVLFDTAPTGHTLRLLSLPTAWTGFLDEGTHGASCLVPLSGLGDINDMYRIAVQSLTDCEKTTLMLIARPEESSLVEANRASWELRHIGVRNQMLIINGLLQSHMQDDKVSVAFYERQQYALNKMPEELKQLKTLSLPYVSYSLTGIDNMRKLVSNNPFVETEVVSNNTELIQMPKLNDL